MKIINQLKVVIIIAAISVASQAQAATYYVATSGSDANNGTSVATAFKTVQKAVGVVRAGDTVTIKPGSHAPFDLRNINGAIGAPITFFGEPGAIIDRNLGGSSRLRNIEFYGSSYITIDGLELTDTDPMPGSVNNCSGGGNPYSGRQAIKMNPDSNNIYPHHLIFKNLHVHGTASHSILGTANDSMFLYNNIHDLGDRAKHWTAYGTYIKGHRWIIRGNRIHDTSGNGIRTGNTPQEGGTSQLLVDSIIENNIVYNHGGTFVHPSGPTGCRLVTGGDGIVVWHGSGNIIRNNIVYNSVGNGIRVNEDFGVNNTSNRVYNNTVYKVGTDGIDCEKDGNKTIVKNNISYLSGGADILGNCTNQLSNNMTSDPLFWDPANGDLGLRLLSPAIDAGATLPEVKTDFTGAPRPDGPNYDIGAFEASGSHPNPAPGGGGGGGIDSSPPCCV